MKQQDPPFTPREWQVLHAMAQGLSCRQTGCLLSMSEHTVRKHRANMLAKQGLHNAPQLIAQARALAWLTPAPGPPQPTAVAA